MIRLGVAVRLLGAEAPALAGARGPNELSHQLIALLDVVRYLARRGVRFYRLAVPEGLGPAALAKGLARCEGLLSELRRVLREQGVRLSLHAGHEVVLNSAEAEVQARSLEALRCGGMLLDALGCVEGVVVVHASRAGGRRAAGARFAAAYEALPAAMQRRIAVEHDDGGGWSLGELLGLHEACGVRVVLDCLHLQLHNPERLRLAEALGLALATWPTGVRAEVHLSSQRTEAHLLPARGGHARAIIPPRPGQHADYIARADGQALLAAARGLAPFDVMVEAKAGELAVLRLREELARADISLDGR
jgi:UV DNA damage endonuclease